MLITLMQCAQKTETLDPYFGVHGPEGSPVLTTIGRTWLGFCKWYGAEIGRVSPDYLTSDFLPLVFNQSLHTLRRHH